MMIRTTGNGLEFLAAHWPQLDENWEHSSRCPSDLGQPKQRLEHRVRTKAPASNPTGTATRRPRGFSDLGAFITRHRPSRASRKSVSPGIHGPDLFSRRAMG
jgi:hypothetical protein